MALYAPKWVALYDRNSHRGILTFLSRNLNEFEKLKTVTWGTASALHEKGTDATIARRVAGHYNLSHKYHLTEDVNVKPHTIFNRFFLYGEGRIDQFSGYMDGFRLWMDLYNNGCRISLRGDTFFKSDVPYSELSVLTLNKLERMSDYSNLKQLSEKYAFPVQSLPAHFKKRENESLNTWFYRLRHIHLHQCFVSALTQLKLGFTIQINPLLTYHTYDLFRRLPDHQQQAKQLFIKMLRVLGPDIPVADADSVPVNTDILARSDVSEYLYEFLNSGFSQSALPPGFIKDISASGPSKPLTSRNDVMKRGYQWFQAHTPAFIKKGIRSHVKSRTLHPGLLAFRVYMLIRMEEILKDDANSLKYLKSNEFAI